MIAKNIKFSDNNLELIKSVLPGLSISAFYSCFSKDTYNYVNWHWHDAFQYCLVTEGSIDFCLPNRSYRVTAGNGIFINTQQIHLCKGTTEQTSAYFCVDVPPAFICADEHSRSYLKYLEPVIRNPHPPALMLSSHSQVPSQILLSLKTIQRLLKDNPDFMELDIQTEIISIWKTTFQLLTLPANKQIVVEYSDNDRLKTIIQYMQQHYSEKITLEDIAAQLMLSRSECCRFFKKVTGQPMFTYLNTLRVNKSMDLLRNSNMSLSEVANAAGFCSQSYFTDCFKKTNKITPKKYRELSLRIPNSILALDVNS